MSIENMYLVTTTDNEHNHQCWFANSRKTAVSTANDAIKAFRDKSPNADWEVWGDFRSDNFKTITANERYLDIRIYDCERITRRYRR